MGSKGEEKMERTGSATGGETAKERVRGVDKDRALRLFCNDNDEVASDFCRRMGVGLYDPGEVGIHQTKEEVDQILQSGKIVVLIPMHEKGGEPEFVPREVLGYLIEDCRIPRQNVIVLNDRSGEEAVVEAKRWKVPVIDVQYAIDQTVDPELFHILGLQRREIIGKGIPIMVGLTIVQTMMERGTLTPDAYVMMHDSELVNVRDYNGARFLTYPLVAAPNQHNHVLGCQVDRGNEAVYAARVGLESIAAFHPDRSVVAFIRQIQPALLRLTWMLTGERIIRAEDFLRIPTATSYVLETAINFGLEGWNLNRSNCFTSQVVIPGSRVDGCNGRWAEQCMMHMICRATNAFAMTGKPSHSWSTEEIAEINRRFGQMEVIPILPETAGAPICRAKKADRVIPAVDTLFEHGWVNRNRLGGILDQLF